MSNQGKWDKALADLAQRIQRETTTASIEAELYLRIVPLLDRLDQETCSVRCQHRDCLRIREELTKWQTK